MRWTLPPFGHACFVRHGQRVVFAVVCAVATGLALKNLLGTYADLGIYLDVAREFSAGGANLYRDRPDSGPWLYPHVAVLPFALLLQGFGDTGARIGWCLLLGLGTAWTVRSAARAVAPFGGLRPWQWFVFALLFQRCFAQNLTHGQLSLWVGAFTVAGTAALVQGRARSAGLWLGIAAALKLTPVLFLVALPLMGRWRAALAMAVTIVVAVLLVPWPFCGTDEHLRHLQDFARSVQQAVLTPNRRRSRRAMPARACAGRSTTCCSRGRSMRKDTGSTCSRSTTRRSAPRAGSGAPCYWRCSAPGSGAPDVCPMPHASPTRPVRWR